MSLATQWRYHVVFALTCSWPMAALTFTRAVPSRQLSLTRFGICPDSSTTGSDGVEYPECGPRNVLGPPFGYFLETLEREDQMKTIKRNGAAHDCTEEDLTLLSQVDHSNRILGGKEHPLIVREREHNKDLDRASSFYLRNYMCRRGLR